MDKIIVTKNGIVESDFTLEEITQRELDYQAQQEQSLLDSLLPTDKEMLMAEIEIQTITVMMEVGLI